MLIYIIAASRRVGDVIMCNKVDLKIKNNMRINILSRASVTEGNFLLNTSTQRHGRELHEFFPLKNQQRAVTNSHWQLQIKLVSTQQKGRAGTKDTAALSPREKQLVNDHRGKLSTLPRCCFTSQSSSTDVRGSFYFILPTDKRLTIQLAWSPDAGKLM